MCAPAFDHCARNWRRRNPEPGDDYSDCNTSAGLNLAARAAGIVVAKNVIATISNTATVRIKGSDARIAYTRFDTSRPEK